MSLNEWIKSFLGICLKLGEQKIYEVFCRDCGKFVKLYVIANETTRTPWRDYVCDRGQEFSKVAYEDATIRRKIIFTDIDMGDGLPADRVIIGEEWSFHCPVCGRREQLEVACV